MLFFSSVDFILKLNFFSKKNLSGIPSECQTVWIQIRPDVLSGLIWIQTVCKGYQQTTLKLYFMISLVEFNNILLHIL